MSRPCCGQDMCVCTPAFAGRGHGNKASLPKYNRHSSTRVCVIEGRYRRTDLGVYQKSLSAEDCSSHPRKFICRRETSADSSPVAASHARPCTDTDNSPSMSLSSGQVPQVRSFVQLDLVCKRALEENAQHARHLVYPSPPWTSPY